MPSLRWFLLWELGDPCGRFISFLMDLPKSTLDSSAGLGGGGSLSGRSNVGRYAFIKSSNSDLWTATGVLLPATGGPPRRIDGLSNKGDAPLLFGDIHLGGFTLEFTEGSHYHDVYVTPQKKTHLEYYIFKLPDYSLTFQFTVKCKSEVFRNLH